MQPAPVTKILPHFVCFANTIWWNRNTSSGHSVPRAEQFWFSTAAKGGGAAQRPSQSSRWGPRYWNYADRTTADARVALSPQPLAEIKLSGGFFLTVRD